MLGRGSTVVAHPDGRLAAYLDSLGRLHDLAAAGAVSRILPGHGPVLDDALAAIEGYQAHRAERLEQVRAALAAGADTPRAVVELVYADVDPALWPAAELSVRAQLDYLASLTSPPSSGERGQRARRWRRSTSRMQYGAGLQPEPAAAGEVGQRLVDRLPGGPDQLGQLLLGQVVRDQDPGVRRPAEPRRQVEQRLGHPAGHVGEDQVGQVLVGPPQPLGQGLQQLLGHLRAGRSARSAWGRARCPAAWSRPRPSRSPSAAPGRTG